MIMCTAVLIVAPHVSAAVVPEMALELPVQVYAALDSATLDLVRTSTMDHLRPAGIHVAWRHCRSGADACRPAPAARAVTVRVVGLSAADINRCGGAYPDSVDGDVVMIYLPCHRDAIRTLRTKLPARADPWLATLEVGHLIGLTVAHEIGHVLGLTHAQTGIMQPRFDLADFLELRLSRLAFTARERLLMRQSMLARFYRFLTPSIAALCTRPPAAGKNAG
jgi:hypothetical protein